MLVSLCMNVCVYLLVFFVCSGTFAVTSIMVGNVVVNLAPDSNFLVNGTNGTTVDADARDFYRLEIAMALTILIGIFQVCVFASILTKLKTNDLTKPTFKVIFHYF